MYYQLIGELPDRSLHGIAMDRGLHNIICELVSELKNSRSEFMWFCIQAVNVDNIPDNVEIVLTHESKPVKYIR